MKSLKGRDLLDVASLSREEIESVYKKADELLKASTSKQLKELPGKTIVMLFEKNSTRTRLSFEVGMDQLGGHAVWLSSQNSQMSRGEPVSDTAKVISRYSNGVVARMFSHKDLEELARESTIPVINGLTDLHHPCQALSDLYTVKKHFKKLKGVKVAFLGDGGTNTCHSLMEACARLGVDLNVSSPSEYSPDQAILKNAQSMAAENDCDVQVIEKPEKAVSNCDVVYTDTWVSMGFEAEAEHRLESLQRYLVDATLMNYAKESAVFMHCLPAHRGQEVSPEVIDGEQSIVFDQAENRLHVQKSILSLLLK